MGCCAVGNERISWIVSPKSNQSEMEMLTGSELSPYVRSCHSLVLCDSTDTWSVPSERWPEMPPCARVLDLQESIILVSAAVVACIILDMSLSPEPPFFHVFSLWAWEDQDPIRYMVHCGWPGPPITCTWQGGGKWCSCYFSPLPLFLKSIKKHYLTLSSYHL